MLDPFRPWRAGPLQGQAPAPAAPGQPAPPAPEAPAPEAPEAGPLGGDRLTVAGAADYCALPWDAPEAPAAAEAPAPTEPEPSGSAVDRAKAWGQRLLRGL